MYKLCDDFDTCCEVGEFRGNHSSLIHQTSQQSVEE